MNKIGSGNFGQRFGQRMARTIWAGSLLCLSLGLCLLSETAFSQSDDVVQRHAALATFERELAPPPIRRALPGDNFSPLDERPRDLPHGQSLAQRHRLSPPAQAAEICETLDYREPIRLDVEYGRELPMVDGIGWLVGIPDKLLLWDRRAKNHRVSEQSVDAISDYLIHRGIADVKVRVNQYDPIGEWRRLVANKRIAPGWKYTVGTWRHLGYSLFPGRIFGRDKYNPFTNSLSLYSDIPELGLAESAYAYDVQQRWNPGNYVVAQSLPFISLWHETLATEEVLSYVAVRGTSAEQEKAKHILYARYGIGLGDEICGVIPGGGSIYRIVGALTGHARANIENRRAHGRGWLPIR